MSKKADHYDIVVLGAGMAGLTLCARLADSGLRILCLEAGPIQKTTSDLRTTAISYGSSKILDKAGIWDKLEPKGCPIRDIEILDGDSALLLQFLSEEAEDKDFGWILLNSDIRAALFDRIEKSKTITLKERALVSDIHVDENALITLEDGEQLTCDLLVGTDGRRSFLRGWMEKNSHTRIRGWKYDQAAVICTVEHEHPHQNKAVEHFWPDGPFAVLPMNDDEKGKHRSSLVFTEHGPESQSLMNLTDTEFELAMAAKFPDSYGGVKLASKRQRYPLNLVHASSYIAPHMVLAGDAAHGIHPIAGQGLNLGFRDIDALANLIEDNAADLNNQEWLKDYEAARRADNMAMVAVTDGLVRLFSNKSPSVRFLRRAGLKAVSKIPIAKRFFMSRAMGD